MADFPVISFAKASAPNDMRSSAKATKRGLSVEEEVSEEALRVSVVSSR